MRLDQYVTEETGLSKNKAQAILKADAVLVNGKIVTKSGFVVKKNDIVEISQTEESKYVARSAIKLKKYLETFPHDIK